MHRGHDLFKNVLAKVKGWFRKAPAIVAPQVFHVPDPAPRKLRMTGVPGAFGREYGLNGKRNPNRPCKHFRIGQKHYQVRGY